MMRTRSSVRPKKCQSIIWCCWILLLFSCHQHHVVVSQDEEQNDPISSTAGGDLNENRKSAVDVNQDDRHMNDKVLRNRLDSIMERVAASNEADESMVILKEGIEVLEHYIGNDLSPPEGVVTEYVMDQVVKIYSTAGYILFQYVAAGQLDPTKRQSYLTSINYFEEGLRLVTLHNFNLPKNYIHFWSLISQTYLKLKQSCNAAEYYLKIFEQFNSDLSQFDDMQRMDILMSIGSCWPDKGVELWNQMFEKKLLDVRHALKCRRCWLLLMTATARSSGGIAAANELFDKLKVSRYTPYRYPLQVPPIVNALLITQEPKPFLNPKDHEVCRRLQDNKDVIIQEYQQYIEKVQKGKIWNLYDPNHEDTSLSEGGGGGWEGLLLRRVVAVEKNDTTYMDGDIGWQGNRCDHLFPQTCAMFHNLPEVDGKLMRQGFRANCGNHENSGHGQGWCLGFEDQLAGVVGFWALEPGAVVRLHAGSTNERLKCHLVVDDGGGGSYMEVGGIRRNHVTGEVIAFDDSFLHMVANEGTKTRVILDVTFFHPHLLTDLHPPPSLPEETTRTQETDPLARIARTDL